MHQNIRMAACALCLSWAFPLWAQPADSTKTEEEDYSQYENASFADGTAKRYCSSKVFDQSPMRFVSIGYDMQLGHSYAPVDSVKQYASTSIRAAQGVRFSANIPIISSNKIAFQMGVNYAETHYGIDSTGRSNYPAMRSLKHGLRTMGIMATLFKPLNERTFLIGQGTADMNGDYAFGHLQSLNTLKYGISVIAGRKKHDRLMTGFGLSHTYRGGQPAYFPVVMLNYTAPSRKWGTEILLPARAAYRRTFSARSLMLVGYELEGNSYRLNNYNKNTPTESVWELRRSEVRLRVSYERSLSGFVWVAVQAGYRVNFRFDVDELKDGKDFRSELGSGDLPYTQELSLSNPLYFNVSLNLVSP